MSSGDRSHPAGGKSRPLPPKLYFRIGEVAGLVGVEPHVLRYWEREFRSIRPTKSAKGQRVYSRKDVENLLRVRDLLYRDGFTIAGARKKLQRGEDGHEGHDLRTALEAESTNAASPLEGHDRDDSLSEGDERIRPSPVHQARFEPSGTNRPPRVREKLVALRTEIEAFLLELTGRQ